MDGEGGGDTVPLVTGYWLQQLHYKLNINILFSSIKKNPRIGPVGFHLTELCVAFD